MENEREVDQEIAAPKDRKLKTIFIIRTIPYHIPLILKIPSFCLRGAGRYARDLTADELNGGVT
jgi:hypothetical protein